MRASLIVVSVVSGIEFAGSSSEAHEGNSSLPAPSGRVGLLLAELQCTRRCVFVFLRSLAGPPSYIEIGRAIKTVRNGGIW